MTQYKDLLRIPIVNYPNNHLETYLGRRLIRQLQLHTASVLAIIVGSTMTQRTALAQISRSPYTIFFRETPVIIDPQFSNVHTFRSSI